MTGLFGSLNTATGGMRAQQGALQTTGHNLANTNTDGYSRQRVNMTTSFPQSMPGIGQMGTGVQISGVTRVADDYITRQLESELSSLTQHDNISDVLGQLEAIFNEPSDSSVSHQMSEFFAAWGSLGEGPEVKTGKTLVVSQSQSFVDTINHIANKIDQLSNDTVGQIQKDVLDFNSTTEQLKKVNDQIFSATIKGERPNDLLDTQDRLLGDLKRIAGVDIKKDKYDRAIVSLDGNEIVSSDKVNELVVSVEEPIRFSVKASDDTENAIDIEQGSIKGFNDALDKVRAKEDELDTYVVNFAQSVNTIMTDGDKDNLPFFTFDIGNMDNPAQAISVNNELVKNPGLLVTSKDFNDDLAAGDGSRAKAVADLQSTSLNLGEWKTVTIDGKETIKLTSSWVYDSNTMSFTKEKGGSPMFNHYNDIITGMGIEKQQADKMVANQIDLASLLVQRRESVSGVDMNEEVVDMIRFSSAFQANARMISTINDMLDTLINRTGV